MMWAITIVQNESWMPSWEKMISAEIPATISGVTRGISISTFAAGLQRVAGADEADREHRAEDGGGDHRHHRDLERGEQRLAQRRVVEELLVPVRARSPGRTAAT